MGSRCQITVYASSEAAAADACARAFDRISRLNAVLSDYDPKSEASRVMRLTPDAWHDISQDLYTALKHSADVHHATDGAFDPTVGRLTALWRDAVRTGRMPPADRIAEARRVGGMSRIHLRADRPALRFDRTGIRLDFGGIGKGMATDEALAVLKDAGITSALIDFGGDIRAGDPPPGSPAGWTIAVRDGLGTAYQALIANAAIATSGDAERRLVIDGRVYSHVLDPRRGLGLTRRVSATVIAPAGWLADALASAACVLEPEAIQHLEQRFQRVEIRVHRADLQPGETPSPDPHAEPSPRSGARNPTRSPDSIAAINETIRFRRSGSAAQAASRKPRRSPGGRSHAAANNSNSRSRVSVIPDAPQSPAGSLSDAPLSSLNSHARAYAQSRSTVRGETPSISAVSSTLMPP